MSALLYRLEEGGWPALAVLAIALLGHAWIVAELIRFRRVPGGRRAWQVCMASMATLVTVLVVGFAGYASSWYVVLSCVCVCDPSHYPAMYRLAAEELESILYFAGWACVVPAMVAVASAVRTHRGLAR